MLPPHQIKHSLQMTPLSASSMNWPPSRRAEQRPQVKQAECQAQSRAVTTWSRTGSPQAPHRGWASLQQSAQRHLTSGHLTPGILGHLTPGTLNASQLNVNYYAAAKSIDTYSRLINSNTSGCCCR